MRDIKKRLILIFISFTTSKLNQNLAFLPIAKDLAKRDSLKDSNRRSFVNPTFLLLPLLIPESQVIPHFPFSSSEFFSFEFPRRKKIATKNAIANRERGRKQKKGEKRKRKKMLSSRPSQSLFLSKLQLWGIKNSPVIFSF